MFTFFRLRRNLILSWIQHLLVIGNLFSCCCSSSTTLNTLVSEKIRRIRSSSIKNNHTQYRTIDRRILIQQDQEEYLLNKVCNDILILQEGYGDNCSCSDIFNNDDDNENSSTIHLNCTENYCLYCDDSFESCGESSYSFELGLDGSPPDFIVGATIIFNYTRGDADRKDKVIALRQSDCDYSLSTPSENGNSCGECQAYINDEECNSCIVCGGGTNELGFDVNCENLSTNSSFNECDSLSGPDSGIFEGFTFLQCYFDPPDNDICDNSTLLTLNVPVVKTLSGATSDVDIPSCATGIRRNSVWFSVVGNGKTMAVSTCSYKTSVDKSFDVFTGTCDNLLCVSATESDCFGFISGGRISWKSESGLIYYIRVRDSQPNGLGEYEILAIDVIDVANNSACIVADERDILDIAVSTQNLKTSELEEDPCGNVGSPGLWYKVTAINDGVIRASTCSMMTSLDTMISVMEGTDCTSLVCVSSSSASEGISGCQPGGTIVDWSTTVGETYYVYVRGLEAFGVFGITIRPLVSPKNDLCTEATILMVDDNPVEGTTVNATIDQIGEAPCLGEAYSSFRGIWYGIKGNGNTLRATLCSERADTFMSIYRGTCSKLECVTEGSIDDFCNNGRVATWKTIDGVDYYMFVYSSDYPGSSFELSLIQFNPPAAMDCSGAIGPLGVDQTIFGSTKDSIYDGQPECLSQWNSPGLWYTVVGEEGRTFIMDTCSVLTDFDTEISVYRGDW